MTDLKTSLESKGIEDLRTLRNALPLDRKPHRSFNERCGSLDILREMVTGDDHTRRLDQRQVPNDKGSVLQKAKTDVAITIIEKSKPVPTKADLKAAINTILYDQDADRANNLRRLTAAVGENRLDLKAFLESALKDPTLTSGTKKDLEDCLTQCSPPERKERGSDGVSSRPSHAPPSSDKPSVVATGAKNSSFAEYADQNARDGGLSVPSSKAREAGFFSGPMTLIDEDDIRDGGLSVPSSKAGDGGFFSGPMTLIAEEYLDTDLNARDGGLSVKPYTWSKPDQDYYIV